MNKNIDMYQVIKNFLLYNHIYNEKNLIIQYISDVWKENIFLNESVRPSRPIKYFVDNIFFLQVIERLSLSDEEKKDIFTKPFLEILNPKTAMTLLNQILELRPLYDFLKYIHKEKIKFYFREKKK